MSRMDRRKEGGFSLIEMIVAIVILALSLGMLYQAAAGATRNVRIDERYSYAVLMAQSVLAENSVVAVGGVSGAGETEGYRWRLSSRPLASGSSVDVGPVPLYALEVHIEWDDGSSSGRQLTLVTVVPEASAGV
jgi:general secretion pathway protein I|tara:strand:+ start:106577 stop:106978 length:402 start_codon:yes stop_codon:yes gene_type:complete